MRTTLFAINSASGQKTVGYGLIVPQARYCSIRSVTDASRLERRALSLTYWKTLENMLAEALPSAPLSRDHLVSRTIIYDERDFVVQFLATIPVEPHEPADTVGVLDAILLSQPSSAAAAR